MLRRIEEIDSLRGIAAISVMIYHYTAFIQQNYIQDFFLFNLGFYGVHLFFIISGFVIFMTVKDKDSIKSFMINRFSRLFPTYIIAVSLTFFILVLFKDNYTVGYLNYLVNLTMLQEFIGISHIDGVYWTLTKELIFYFLITSLLFFKIKNFDNFLIWFVLYLLLVKVLNKVLPSIDLLYILEINNYLQFFVIGMLLYLIYREKLNYKKVFVFVVSLVITFGSGNYKELLVAVFISIIFLLLFNNKLSILKNTLLIFLGEISYSLYLIHNEIGKVIIVNLFPVMGGKYDNFDSCKFSTCYSYV